MNVVSGSGFALGLVVAGWHKAGGTGQGFSLPRQCLCKKALQGDMLYWMVQLAVPDSDSIPGTSPCEGRVKQL
jgi:hypothetical protein